MKEVITGEVLKNKMLESINLLCDTVSKTLGPTGNNILINNSDTSPFITNDGVTIASNIESQDTATNTILEIIKEASLKTNELVGDGTTTTLVLLKSIYTLGIDEINNGTNPIILKNELNKTLNKIVEELKKKSKSPNLKDYYKIAYNSSNMEEIAEVTSNLFSKMNSKYSIKLEEGYREKTYYEIKKGYNLELDNISNMYFSKEKEISLKDVNVLVLKGYLSNLEDISEIINEGLKDKNTVIFVEEMDEAIKNQLLVYFLTNKKNIFIFTLPEYASRREKIENDLKVLANCTIKNIDYENVYYSDVGLIDEVKITKEEVVLSTNSLNTNKLIEELKNELENTYNEYEKEFIETRLSKLEEGIATIYVGGITKSEKREKLLRYEDSLCALEVSKGGIVKGEGLTYLEVSDILNEDDVAERIIKKSLEEPFIKIMENLGVDYKDIEKEIRDSNYKKIYDYRTSSLINTDDSNIIDPLEVVVASLKNATSIASLLLTTSSLVINENKELEKDIL